jgi:hypothetical protein
MESEPDRVPGLAANECAGNAVGFDCSALRSRKMKPPGRGHRLESEWGSVRTLWIMSTVFRRGE